MGIYEASVLTVASTTGTTIATFHTAASSRARIREIDVFTQAATASFVGIIRPTNTPVASTSVLGQAEDPADAAATANLDTAWSTAPTVGSNVYLRRFQLAAAIGAGAMATWPIGKELVVPVSSWLVFWNYGGTTNSILALSVVWEE